MGNNRTLITIIVPVYNTAKYLQQCIDSIILQTFKNFELIIVDDGSYDGSSKICDRFRSKNIKVVHQENSGVSAARNVGIEKARGDYIMFVDSDDVIEPEMLSSLYETAKKFNYPDVVIAELDSLKAEIKWYDDFLEFISFNEFWSPCAKLFKRDKIKYYFDENVFIAEDLWFCYQNHKVFSNFVYLPKKLYRYRKNKNSAMKKNRMVVTDLTCLDVVLRIINDPEISEKLRLFYMAYYIKIYYYIFSKKTASDIGKSKKRWYGRYIHKFYKQIKEAEMIDAKMFVQVKLTPIYNLSSRLRR